MKVVGIYAAASVVDREDDWTQVRTQDALLFPVGLRRDVSTWPGPRGVRRWAWRDGGVGREHDPLRRLFVRLKRDLSVRGTLDLAIGQQKLNGAELYGIEGAQERRLGQHRKREVHLRQAKLREALRLSGGHLICEVPRCGFDFLKRYGALGGGYAQVHHLLPLGRAPQHGRKTSLKDLAVVCANCHAMIHRDGQCRSIKTLDSRFKLGRLIE